MKLLYILCVIFLISCGIKRENNYPLNLPPAINKTFYVDKDIVGRDKDLLEAAKNEWEVTTRGMVKLSFIYKYNVVDKNLRDFPEKNIILTTTRDNEIYKEFRAHNHEQSLLGFSFGYDHKYLGIIRNNINSDYKLKLVIIHELGHIFGLKHIDLKYPAIMNQGSDYAKCLTINDMNEFCGLYNCNPQEMNYCDMNKYVNKIQ